MQAAADCVRLVSDENIEKVEDLVISQKDKSKTHRITCEISRETDIPRLIHSYLQLKCFKWRRAQVLSVLLLLREMEWKIVQRLPDCFRAFW